MKIENKNVLAIHDISCIGRCSLTVALPIISAFGVECRLLPTSLLSTHTGGFKNFTYLDLTNEMENILEAWKQLDLTFTAIYSGFMANPKQIDILKSTIKAYPSLSVVDPVMADNGELYGVFDQAFVEKMKEVVPVANILIPNITEACLLTDFPYQESINEDFIENLASALQNMGAKNIVITGISFEQSKIGAAVVDEDGNISYAMAEKQPSSYHGTGDIFGSVFTAELVNGKSIQDAAQAACEFVVSSIKATDPDADKKYGVNFEMALANRANK
ncbi:pyridoxamine kinase [Lactovum miscens]|uniref:pyridoxal kinase n=1 Tax=Lactovum miscens TaxID=190387 RepID=A0A841C9X2_9LACT|nr:pyridoxamine kinase [Lactovum miscens]MBB5888518.1 pyridoxine kinase [Lactovum miscens]